MEPAKTMKAFLLFASLEDGEPWRELVEGVMAEVRAALREDADENDARLCSLAAAIANLRYRNIQLTQFIQSQTYAGKVDVPPRLTVCCDLAQTLVMSYTKTCAPLLKPDTGFVFQAV